ncbi:MAG: 50S ribosomal protein L22 [Patescibacteria group bacterium]|nr:50S ribosomal protein L22 [Patescibacteria group bacterium]
MEVKAKARFIRMSPKKVRLVADLVRGMDIDKAEAQLKFIKKAASRPVLKLIQSARANAEHNFKLTPEILFIKTITVDGGPVLHRWKPRAFGRATPIRKRTSHITVVLDEKTKEGAPKDVKAAVVGKREKGQKEQKREKKEPSSAEAAGGKEEKTKEKKAEKKDVPAKKPAVKKSPAKKKDEGKPDVKKKESAS